MLRLLQKEFVEKDILGKSDPGDIFLKLQTLMNTIGGNAVMHVNDFPKNNKSENLTVITITTDPPIICHGSGSDSIASRDEAALEVALRVQELTSMVDVKAEQQDDSTMDDKNATISESNDNNPFSCDKISE